MKRRFVLLITLVLIAHLLPAAPVHARQQARAISPRAMLIEYYGNINSRRYDLAYARWIAPTQTYAQFVNGYADTAFVEAHFGGFQVAAPGVTYGRIPAVLIGYRHNGTVAAFFGCYDLGYMDDLTNQWWITGANIQPLPSLPNAATIPSYLDTFCYPRIGAPGTYDTVQQMLVDHYDAVNRQDYAAAYALWVNPPATFQQFVAGYSTTTDVVLFYGNYQFSGSYTTAETGRVPVVLLGYHTDGSMVAFQGCLLVSYNLYRSPYWGILGAALLPVPFTVTPSRAAIQQALATNCYGR